MSAAATTDRFVVERFDGLLCDIPRVRDHLAFIRRQDAFALGRHHRRSYVVPDRCSACALIVAAYEAQQNGLTISEPTEAPA